MIRGLLKQLKIYSCKPEYIAFYFALFFGTISAFIVPQMTVNDEGAHLLKSYNLSEGNMSGKLCKFPQSIFDEASSSPEHIPKNSHLPINYKDTSTKTCGSAAGYSPIMHLPQTTGITIAKLVNGSPD